jgi:hypothetical protein
VSRPGRQEAPVLAAAIRSASKKTHVGIWVLLTLSGPSIAWAQPSEEQQKIAALLQQIQDVEARDGPNSEELIDPLTTLGRLQQDAGQPLQSAAAIQRAVDVIHVNQGLHSLDQAPLIRLLIGDAEAIGDARTAWDLEQELLSLANRHPDDVRAARILRETADRRLAVLDKYIAGHEPTPEIRFGCYYREPANETCGAGRSDVAQSNLFWEAQQLYSQAIGLLLSNERYPADDLQTLVEDLARKTYRYCPRRVADPLGAESRENVILQCNRAPTRHALVSLVRWQIENSQAWQNGIETLVEIADWDLLYANSVDADETTLQEYTRVYELLAEQGAQESIDRIFSPQIPVIVPAFAPNPLSREQRGDGYIDVSFEIDKHGKSHHIRILGTTTDSTRAAAKRFVQFISGSRFRPRVADGRLADSAPVVVRYYFD